MTVSLRGKLLIAALVLLILGFVGMFAIDTRGPEPDFVCVEEGHPSSGFTDLENDECPISIESYNEWREWKNQPRPTAVIGLGLVVVSLGLGVTGLIVGRRKKGTE